MQKKISRNDPCPCGSGKKYKACCLKSSGGRKKINAKVISSGPKINKEKAPDLMERTFGAAIRASHSEERPPSPEDKGNTLEGNTSEEN